ncbi:MAG: outer membrane protein assembly factor BamB family protein [Anaerolineae bacterium]
MRRILRGGRFFVLVIILVLAITGCSSRGVVNPGWTVVAVDGTSVYSVLASGKVVALDAASGSEQWHYPIVAASSGGIGSLFAPKSASTETNLNAVYGSPIFTSDLVVVGTFDNKLVAFNRSSGQKAWEFTAGGSIVGGALVHGDTIYFGASDSMVYAVKPNASAGEQVWSVKVSGSGIWGEPAADDQNIYVGSLDHHVYALNQQTGAIVWDRDMGAAIPGGVTLANKLVLVGGVAKKLTALDTSTGAVVWEHQFSQWVWGEIAVQNDIAYASSIDGQVHAVKLSDGSVIWDAQLQGATRSGPLIVGDYLAIGTNTGNVYRIDMTTGKAELLYAIPSTSVLSRVAALGNQIYVGTTTASVVALDITRVGGTPVWTYPVASK